MARRALGRAWSLYISSPAAECSISGSTWCQSVRYSTAVEAKGLTQLKAFLREDSGKKISKTIRKGGRVPGVVFSLPQEQELLVSFAAKDIETQLLRLGRTGWGCHLFDVAVMNGDGKKMTHYPAVGRQVHITADTDVVENVTLIHCPPDRHVKVAVPIQVGACVWGRRECDLPHCPAARNASPHSLGWAGWGQAADGEHCRCYPATHAAPCFATATIAPRLPLPLPRSSGRRSARG
ncbi:MRPL25 [Auxenochlorella protothecoides x Auxenochlorella symbiontica]